MKLLSSYITTIFFLGSLCFSYSQQGKIQSAENDYENFAYVKTSQVLLEVANKGYRSVDLLQKLANSYYFRSEMEEAVKWYAELMTMNEVIDPEYYFRYALALKGIEDYANSDIWMNKFHELKPSDLRGKAFKSKTNYKSEIEELSRENINLINVEFNSELSDFGATEYENGLVFTSSRGGGRIYSWNNEPYLDIYSVEKTETGYGEVNSIKGKINTKYHESSAVFSPNGKYMFFSSNNFFKLRYKEDEGGFNRVQLYRATRSEDGSWDEIHKVHFNSDSYSVAHPALNLTGTKLYFASDMPGTFGQSDIFVVDVNEDGTLGNPENLGSAINTEGQETFPFVNTDGDLYFSSNGYPGLGGFDIFVSDELDNKIQEGSNRNFPIDNLGKPVNSSADDFAYYENLVTRQAYLSSNREGGVGSDDIYAFKIPDCEQLVTGKVIDKDTGELIPLANVILYDAEGNELERKTVNNDATYRFKLDCKKEYLIRGEKEKYTSFETRILTPKKSKEWQVDLLLKKDEQFVEPCDDLVKILDIPIIYFDFDQSIIRNDAEVELQKVLVVLNRYPTMTIDIKSHTDCRGTEEYNNNLSELRAQTTRQYLIDNDIDAIRIIAKGYGESQPVNDCNCDDNNKSNCSREEHQLNRRSEFIVTSIKGSRCKEN